MAVQTQTTEVPDSFPTIPVTQEAEEILQTMICVYPAVCTDVSTNGNGTIEPTSALVMETLNGEYELQLVHPIDDAGKWQRLVEGCQIEQI